MKTKPLTIKQALAWPDPPPEALSWLEPHLICEASGIWVTWYLTDGRKWQAVKREEIKA